MSLAQFLADQGCQQQARDLLASVYGRCAEGFGTPDPQRWKALWDEIG
jgi:hypothetical protein